MATRSSDMPRMRSASMALLGLDETRISFSRSVVTALLLRLRVPFCGKGSDRPLQPALEVIGRLDAGEALADEDAQAGVHRRAPIAFGAVAQVTLELLLAGFGEGTIEEKVDCAFDIVTEHCCLSFL